MSGPVFKAGDRIELRPTDADDLGFLERLINDPAVRAEIHSARPKNRAREEDWFDSWTDDEDQYHFVIAVDGARVGHVSMHVDDVWGVGEVGYSVLPEEWGNGYCTEAVELVAEYAFDELRLHRLAAEVIDGNVPSRRVLEKVGFAEEGRKREEAFVEGEFRDVLQFGLLREEFESA